MPKRTGEDFLRQATKHGIAKWPIRPCSMCGYMCGFVFHVAPGYDSSVGFDSGCHCTGGPVRLRSCTWQQVADRYNYMCEDSPELVADTDVLWQFNNMQVVDPRPFTLEENYARDFEGRILHYVIDKVQNGAQKICGNGGDASLFLVREDAVKFRDELWGRGLLHAEVRAVLMPYTS